MINYAIVIPDRGVDAIANLYGYKQYVDSMSFSNAISDQLVQVILTKEDFVQQQLNDLILTMIKNVEGDAAAALAKDAAIADVEATISLSKEVTV